MDRWSILNYLIKKYGYKKYLEIGVQNGHNFALVECDYKVGVDPFFNPTHKMTSDEFFSTNKEVFDLIFIDGLHQCVQVSKDIENALGCLSENGIIMCHDCYPISEHAQLHEPHNGVWMGCTWKAWVKLRASRDDLETFVIDTDCGCGIIRRKPGQTKLDLGGKELTYDNFIFYKFPWLNLKPIDEAMNLL